MIFAGKVGLRVANTISSSRAGGAVPDVDTGFWGMLWSFPRTRGCSVLDTGPELPACSVGCAAPPGHVSLAVLQRTDPQ